MHGISFTTTQQATTLTRSKGGGLHSQGQEVVLLLDYPKALLIRDRESGGAFQNLRTKAGSFSVGRTEALQTKGVKNESMFDQQPPPRWGLNE